MDNFDCGVLKMRIISIVNHQLAIDQGSTMLLMTTTHSNQNGLINSNM